MRTAKQYAYAKPLPRKARLKPARPGYWCWQTVSREMNRRSK